MLFVPLGATDAIGASCHYLQIEGTGILLDAGVDPEREGVASLPRLDLLRRGEWFVDHCIVTHAHHDHIGGLPIVVRDFPHVRVHMTRETRELAHLLLPASARLQRRKLREGSTSAAPLFDEDELEAVSFVYESHQYDEWFDVTGVRGRVEVRARLWYAGHILGAAGVELEYEADGGTRRIFYTGDTNLRHQTILPGGDYPEAVDVLFLESTTGADSDAEDTTRRAEESRFGDAINEVLTRAGCVLVPVFALGRAQEVLALLDRYRHRGVIPRETEIYTAGSMRAIANVYDDTRFATPRLNNEFEVTDVDQRRVPRSPRARLESLRTPSVHIVPSGMMFERTLSNELAQVVVEDTRSAIFMVGYAAPETPGGLLLAASVSGKDNVTLNATRGPQAVNCDVKRFRLSGHSHRRDLLELVANLNPSKVVLVHGDENALEWMEDNVRYFHPDKEVVMPAVGKPVTL